MLNDVNNDFEKLIRSKFEDYRTSVDSGNWDAIEKSLIKSKRIRYIYIAASFVAAAAATVLLLVTLNQPKNNDNQKHGTEQASVLPEQKIPEIKEQNPVPETTVQPSPTTETEQEKQNLENQTKPAPNPVSAYNADAKTLVAQVEIPEPKPDGYPLKGQLKFVPRNIFGVSTNLSSSNKLQLSGNNVSLSLSVNKKPDDTKNDNHMQDNKRDMSAKIDKKWSVLMSFGAGNYQLSNVNTKNSDLIMSTPLLASSESTDYIRNQYKNEIMIPDNANTQHGLPLSAKFILRKDLGSGWAVESGLSYTYLSTKYRWNKNTATQQLHYLGIPVNVVYYVISKSDWNVYASSGGMAEKGVYSYINRNDKDSSKANMKSLQWSVNGAIGVTYKLSRSVGLFFEPQVGYFFNNGYPESIRTDSPVSFGLGIGLRFSL
jgi:hypothetical protein